MTRPSHRLLALAALLSLLVLNASLPVLAQSGEASGITHRQSVRVEMDPTGDIDSARVFTQLTVQGSGQVEVTLPDQATRSLRNLDGFGRPQIDSGQVVHTLDASPDGTHARTVATHEGDLPIELSVAYRLDGQDIAPRDLVGRSGELEVSFTARNTTAVPVEVEYRDGRNVRQRETIDVSVPFVGSISMDLDRRFVDVSAPGASVAGNGRGDTFVSWSMVLFSPVGSEEQTVTYTAQVTDAIVPGVVAQFLPVDSGSFTSLASVQETFGGVADGLRDLTGGALQIDSNLTTLAVGSSQLLIGVGRLSRGASDLAEGLNETAVPGAAQLADGTGQARDGSQQLAAGALTAQSGSQELAAGMGTARAGGQELAAGLGQLSSGAGDLSAGLGQARAGSTQLSSGLGQLAAGSQELNEGGSELAAGADEVDANMALIAAGAADLQAGAAAVLAGLEQLQSAVNAPTGTPALIAGATALRAGADGLISGIGSASTDGTILNALTQLKLGVDNPTLIGDQPGLQQGIQGLEGALFTGTDIGEPFNETSVRDLVTQVRDQLAMEVVTGGGDPAADIRVQRLTAALGILGASPASDSTVWNGLARLEGGASALFGGLVQLEGGVSNPGAFVGNPTCLPTAVPANRCGLLQGLQLLAGGIDNPAASTPGAPTFNPRCLAPGDEDYAVGMAPCGLKQGLELSLAAINAGLGSVDDDPTTNPTLLGGANAVAAGAGTLAGGTARLRTEGTAPLAAGATRLSNGAGQVAEGAGAAASGAQDLDDGLGRLEAGGQQLAAGASTAATGSRDLASGLGQLDDGATQLASGLGQLSSGAGDLASGLGQIDDGANQLASGLGDAGDGATQISEGLETVEGGMTGVAEGSQRLVDEGTQVLIGAASDATSTPALAVEQAMLADARGQAGEGLPYGTADGAVASAVYQYELATITGSQDGPSLPLQGGLAVIALGLAGGLTMLVRGRLT
jgi:putative membrane protein